MDIVIGSEASIATPSAGYVTLFINTDKNNILYAKYPDGSFAPYNGSSGEDAKCIADAWMEAITCALKKGLLDSADFESIMNQGISIQSSSVTDDDGNITSTLNVGSRQNSLVSITVDDDTVTVAAMGTHQIVTTFDPTNTSNQGLLYITSAPSKATVSNTGLITGVATGSAVITVIPVSDPSKAKTITVTIS